MTVSASSPVDAPRSHLSNTGTVAVGKRVTVKEVAARARVSPTAVSVVLNGASGGNTGVSEAARQRILNAAEALGYRRNGLATALRMGRSNTIGIVSPLAWSGVENLQYGYLPRLLAAISVAAGRVGMNAMTFIGSSFRELPVDVIADGRVDGVILFGTPFDQPEAQAWIRGLSAVGVPAVEVGSRYGRYQVHADNEAGARIVVEHLYALGHRRIGFYRAPTKLVSAQRREAGFLAAARAAGLAPEATPVVDSDDTLRLCLQAPERPTAFFCNTDGLALSVYDVARELGLRVPEEVSVVGFDNSSITDVMRPRLTSVDNPLNDMAEAAVSLLRGQIENHDIACPVPTIATSLIVRESTAPIFLR
jgi:LacI family transcriptional regulator